MGRIFKIISEKIKFWKDCYMRINKLLSNYGICSRKDANRIIEDKRVIVNGKLCEKGQWVEETDSILLDG